MGTVPHPAPDAGRIRGPIGWVAATPTARPKRAVKLLAEESTEYRSGVERITLTYAQAATVASWLRAAVDMATTHWTPQCPPWCDRQLHRHGDPDHSLQLGVLRTGRRCVIVAVMVPAAEFQVVTVMVGKARSLDGAWVDVSAGGAQQLAANMSAIMSATLSAGGRS